MNWMDRRGWWTPARVDELTRLWRSGLSASQVQAQMGAVSRSSIIGKVHRLKLPTRPQDTWKESARVTRVMSRKDRQRPTPAKPLIVGSAVMEHAEQRPPRLIVPEEAFHPLPSSTPRPWEDRGKGCNWPVGEGLSCCEPVRAFGWCTDHVALGRKPTPPTRELARSLRRYVA